MKRIILLTLFSALILSSCSIFDSKNNDDPTDPISFDPNIDFVQCGLNLCATFEVPMDHKNPNGRQVELSVIKIPARNQNEKIGSIFINPGGPGGSGVEFVQQNGTSLFSEEVLRLFDIVSWDPRGVGGSTKVTCNENLDPLFEDVDYSPQTEEARNKLIEATKWVGEQCAIEDEALLAYLDTQSTVLDLEALRIAMDEDQLNYLGFSYGTAIGQIYATQFPDKIRTMVLDGVADLTIDPIELAKDQAIGFENSLNSFFEYCETQGCTYNQNRDPRTVYTELASRIRRNPIEFPSDPTLSLGPAQLDIGTAEYLYYGEPGWNILDNGLSDLRSGDPQIILEGFSRYVGRDRGGIYDGKYISFISIGCADGAIADADTMFELAQEVEPDAPIFGQSGILLGLQCSFWPGFDGEFAKAFDLNVENENPIVVIGTTGDPATPFKWAQNVASQIENSVFIEKVGEGHTIFGRGDSCIDNGVNNYFLTGEAPSETKC